MAPPASPLSHYGVIGDGHTAALVSRDGSIDWWCPGRFDAPSVFARLLDPDGGGFSLRVRDAPAPVMAYDPRTNVLRTTWNAGGGRVEVVDFMPVSQAAPADGSRSRIVRLVTVERGVATLEAVFSPRPDYARRRPTLRGIAGGVDCEGIVAHAPHPFGIEGPDARGAWEVKAGDVLALTVESEPPAGATPLDSTDALALLRDTRRHWERWAAEARYEGPYREMVVRSALAIKLLQHAPTGALVAAPTMALPEHAGGVRNWDYRYAWIRDCAFAVGAFYQSGHLEDAGRLAHWAGKLLRRDGAEGLRILYRVDGRVDLKETTLDHLHGHLGSKPVRVGNEAAVQWQLDMYGELVDCLHACRVLGAHREEEVDWALVRGLIDYARRNLDRPDQGIWEVRAEPRHFLVSKAMAWVALDRGVRAIEKLGLPGPLDDWRRAADSLREEALARSWNDELGALADAYGGSRVDAAVLLLPLLGFLPADDPRMRATIDRIRRDLEEAPGLLRRYRGDDGLPGEEGAFVACGFWLVEVLAQAGRIDEAREVFERLLDRATPLGLFSEMIDPRSGNLLGNFPQALSHIGLIQAAAALSGAMRFKGNGPAPRDLSVGGSPAGAPQTLRDEDAMRRP